MPEAKIDEDRLDAWRKQRAKVAEAERDERIRKRDEARLKLEAEKRRLQRDTARALLPQEDALLAAHKRMRRQRFRRAVSFWMQFSVCVLAPVAAAIWYLTTIATPLFEARVVIAITQPDDGVARQSATILGQLTGSDDLQEVFMANEYVHSQALMDQLQAELALETRFSSNAIDPFQRLRVIPGVPYTKRRQFDRFVESSVNVQTGLLTIYVRDPDQALAVQTAGAIIRDTSNQINLLNDAVLDQRLSLARQAVVNSEAELRDAQADLIAVQIRNGDVDPERSIASVYDSIQSLETEVMQLESDITRAQIAGTIESRSAQESIALKGHLMEQIAALRGRLTTPSTDEASSLNKMVMDYEMASLRVDLAHEAHTSALAALSAAKDQGVLGRSVFQVVVPPRTAAQAVYPRTPSLVTLVAIVAMAFFAFIRLFGAGRRNMA